MSSENRRHSSVYAILLGKSTCSQGLLWIEALSAFQCFAHERPLLNPALSTERLDPLWGGSDLFRQPRLDQRPGEALPPLRVAEVEVWSRSTCAGDS